MITALRAFALATLTALPLIAAAPAHAETLPLDAAISSLPVAAEVRDGYQRASFRHWIDADRDGCNTRMEVLIAESRTTPVIESGCKVISGDWYSAYDGVTVTAPGGLDVDHMVPLAEAWDSGASSWTAQRRQDYANDLGAPNSLIAVTAKTNRSKADQDPAEWLPSRDVCDYTQMWVGTKLRWGLMTDAAEQNELRRLAETCGPQTVEYTPVDE
ncbi:HNH endonuclease family protein [Streptomyces liangshanensis]|uniref:HNH endonuclease family protein n=1 Tax=Streptomyces liangshanensis TaxID=2717324 RepID=UPI0036D82389